MSEINMGKDGKKVGNMVKSKRSTRVCTREYDNSLVSCKRSQEEMVGFVLIVVLVTIIALVFFTISVRKTPQKFASSEIESFLEAANRYGTECYSSIERRLDLKDLIIDCYKNPGERCLDNNYSCDVLNETLGKMLTESWKVGEDSPIKAYSFSLYDNINKTIISLKEGRCMGIRAGSIVNIPVYSGVIKEELEICS